MKVVVVGLGSIGKRHIMNLLGQGFTTSEIIGVDPREDRRKETETRFALTRTVSDLKELVNDTLDGAVICSPTSMHIQQGIF